MRGDVRSFRVALVADASLAALLPALEASGWGVIQLPPADVGAMTARLWLEQVAEQVAELRRNGYATILVGDGVWEGELEAALGALGGELPARVEPTAVALEAAAVAAGRMHRTAQRPA